MWQGSWWGGSHQKEHKEQLKILCVFAKYSTREYRAIASWLHLIYFEFRAKVYSGKWDYILIQSLDSSFGANMESDKAEIVRFLQCPSSYFASVHTCLGEIVLVNVHGKKSYSPIIPFTIIKFCEDLKINILDSWIGSNRNDLSFRNYRVFNSYCPISSSYSGWGNNYAGHPVYLWVSVCRRRTSC